jgi:hypothetical protein
MRFGRVKKPEIQPARRAGCQSIMQACFVVVSVGRSFEQVGLGLGRRGTLARRFASGDSVTRQRIRWGARVVSGRPVPVDHGADTTTLVPISTIVLTSASVSTAVRIEHAG